MDKKIVIPEILKTPIHEILENYFNDSECDVCSFLKCTVASKDCQDCAAFSKSNLELWQQQNNASQE